MSTGLQTKSSQQMGQLPLPSAPLPPPATPTRKQPAGIATGGGNTQQQSYISVSQAAGCPEHLPHPVPHLTTPPSPHAQIATSRYVLLVLWMTKLGAGIVPAKDVLSAARRLRIT